MGDQAALGALFGFGIFGFVLVFFLLLLVPFILYLLNLQRCFEAVRPEFRPPMPPALVWLALVPGLGLFVLIAAAVLLSTAVKKEGEARRTGVFGDGGLALGLAAAILGLLSMIPLIGLLLALGSLVCWIMHWIKVAGFRKLLVGAPAGGQSAPPPPPQNWQPAAVPPPPMAPPPPPPVAAVAPPPPAETPAVPGREESTVRFGALDNAKLVCIVGVVQGMSFAIGNGVIVGRSQEADVVVPDSQISNRHAWIGPVQGRLILRDMQSTNGTYLNDNLGAPVQEVELRDGDVIVLGKHGQMKFRASLG